MHDHAAHGDAVVEMESAPFIANLGFALGIIAVILEATIKLAPAAFMIAIPGIVLCALGFVQGTVQSRPVKGAIAGLFCCLFTIIFWLLARGDINAVAGGRDAWPSWLF
jgi:Ca2+/Na+ antiporter